MQPAIRTEGLVKDYGRGAATVRALDALDLEVATGEVFGFLGPNGAGKSTAIRVLLDQLRPTAGRAEVLGVAPDRGGPRLRARIGYLPGELAMSGHATAGELLRHLTQLRGGAGAERIASLAARLSLDLDDVATLRHNAGQRIALHFADPVDAAAFDAVPGISDIEVDDHRLTCLLRGEPDPLLKAAARFHVTRWSAQDRELEDLFLEHYRVPVIPEEVMDDDR